MEIFFGLPILLNIKRGYGALDVFHGTYHPVGVECFQTICAGKRGLADKLVDKREEINLISSLCLEHFWIYQLACCSHVTSCCKILRNKFLQDEAWLQLGFQFLSDFSNMHKVRYWNLLHESSVVRLCLEAALKHIKCLCFVPHQYGKQPISAKNCLS